MYTYIYVCVQQWFFWLKFNCSSYLKFNCSHCQQYPSTFWNVFISGDRLQVVRYILVSSVSCTWVRGYAWCRPITCQQGRTGYILEEGKDIFKSHIRPLVVHVRKWYEKEIFNIGSKRLKNHRWSNIMFLCNLLPIFLIHDKRYMVE